jgi:hypothetical protein
MAEDRPGLDEQIPAGFSSAGQHALNLLSVAGARLPGPEPSTKGLNPLILLNPQQGGTGVAAALSGDAFGSHARNRVVPGEAGGEMGILGGRLPGDKVGCKDIGGDGDDLLPGQGLELGERVQADAEPPAELGAVGIRAAAEAFDAERQERGFIRGPDLHAQWIMEGQVQERAQVVQPGIGECKRVDERHHIRRSVQPSIGDSLETSISSSPNRCQADRVRVVSCQERRAPDGQGGARDVSEEPGQAQLAFHPLQLHRKSVIVSWRDAISASSAGDIGGAPESKAMTRARSNSSLT